MPRTRVPEGAEEAFAGLETEGERLLFENTLLEAMQDAGDFVPSLEPSVADAYRARREAGATAQEAMSEGVEAIKRGEMTPARAALGVGRAFAERMQRIGRRAQFAGTALQAVGNIVGKRAPEVGRVARDIGDMARFGGGVTEGLGGMGRAGALMAEMMASGVLSPENARLIAAHATKTAAIQSWDPDYRPEPMDLRDKEGRPLKFTPDEAGAVGEYYTAMAQTPQYGLALAGAGANALTTFMFKSPKAGKVAGGAVAGGPVAFVVWRDAYSDAKKRGADEVTAVRYATEQAGSEFLDQLFSSSLLTGAAKSAAKQNFVKGIFGAGAGEFASEGVTAMAQEASREGTLEGGSYREGAVESGEQAAKSATLGGAGGTAISTAMSVPIGISSVMRMAQNEKELEAERKKFGQRVATARAHRQMRAQREAEREETRPVDGEQPEPRHRRVMPDLPDSEQVVPKNSLPIHMVPFHMDEYGDFYQSHESSAETDAVDRFAQVNAPRDVEDFESDPVMKGLYYREHEVLDTSAADADLTPAFAQALFARMKRRKKLAGIILAREEQLGRKMNEDEFRALHVEYLIQHGMDYVPGGRVSHTKMADGRPVRLTPTGPARTMREKLSRKLWREDEPPSMREFAESAKALFGADVVGEGALGQPQDTEGQGPGVAAVLDRLQQWTEGQRLVDDAISDILAGRGQPPADSPRRVLWDVFDAVVNGAGNPAVHRELEALGGGIPHSRPRRVAALRKFFSLILSNRPAAQLLAPFATAVFDHAVKRQSPANRARLGRFQRNVHLIAANGRTSEGMPWEFNPERSDAFVAWGGSTGARAVMLAHQSRNIHGLFLEPAYWDTLAWDDIVSEILRKGHYPSGDLTFLGTGDAGGRTVADIFRLAEEMGVSDAMLNRILEGERFDDTTDLGKRLNFAADRLLGFLDRVEMDLSDFLVRIGARAADAHPINLRQPVAQLSLFARGLLGADQMNRGSMRQRIVNEFGAQVQLGLEKRFDALAIKSLPGIFRFADGTTTPRLIPTGRILDPDDPTAQNFRTRAVDKFIRSLEANGLVVVQSASTGELSIVPKAAAVHRHGERNPADPEMQRLLLNSKLNIGSDPFDILGSAGSIPRATDVSGNTVIVTVDPGTRRTHMLEVSDKYLVRALRSRAKLFHGEQSQTTGAKMVRFTVGGLGKIRRWRQTLITARIPFLTLQLVRDSAYQAPMHINAGVLSRIPFAAMFTGFWAMARSAVKGVDLHDHSSQAVRLAARHIRTAARIGDLSAQKTSAQMRNVVDRWGRIRGQEWTKESVRAAWGTVFRFMQSIYISTEIANRLGAAILVERAGLRNNRNLRALEAKGYSVPDIGGESGEQAVAATLGMMDAVGSFIHFGDRPASTGMKYAGQIMEFVNARSQGFAEEMRSAWDKARHDSARGALSRPLGIPASTQLPGHPAYGYVYQATLASIYAGLTALAMGLYIGDDREALEDYRTLPQYARDLYLLFPALGNVVPAPDPAGVTWKLPTSYGFQGVPFTLALSIMENTLLDRGLTGDQAQEILLKTAARLIGELYVMDEAVPWPLVVWAIAETGSYVDNPFADEPFDVIRVKDEKLSDRLQVTGLSEATITLGVALNELGLFGDISPAGDVEPWRRVLLPGAGNYFWAAMDAMTRNWLVSRQEPEFGTNPVDAPSYPGFWKAMGKETGLIIPNDIVSTQGFYQRASDIDIYARSADKVFGPRGTARGQVGDVSDIISDEERERETAELAFLGFGKPEEEARMRVARMVQDGDPFPSEEMNRAAILLREIPKHIRQYREEIRANLQDKFTYDPAIDGERLRTAEEKWQRELAVRREIRGAVKAFNHMYDRYFLTEVKLEEARIRTRRARNRNR